MASFGQQLLGALGRILTDTARGELRRRLRPSSPSRKRSSDTGDQTPRQRTSPRPQAQNQSGDGYPGDFTGRPQVTYSPEPGNTPDPGEVVWTWVPYEEDYSQGKDRPVLLIGHDGGWLLALPLTSKDHDRDAEQEARAGRHWIDVGTGDWDRQGRPSEARVDRIIRVDPHQVRREGGVLDAQIFGEVKAAIEQYR